MRIFLIPGILFLWLCNCSTDYKKIKVAKDDNVKFYRDFSLFSMEGKDEIEVKNLTQIEIPFVEIKKYSSVKEEKQKVIIHYRKDYETVYSCEKKGDKWMCESNYDDPEEGCTYYIFSQHSEDSLIRITYCGHPVRDKDFYLSSVAIESGIVRKVYHYSRFDKVKKPVSFDLEIYRLDECFRWEQTFYTMIDGVIMDYGEIINTKSGEVISRGKNCFWIDEMSFFWFRYNRHRLPEVNCDYYDIPKIDSKKEA